MPSIIRAKQCFSHWEQALDWGFFYLQVLAARALPVGLLDPWSMRFPTLPWSYSVNPALKEARALCQEEVCVPKHLNRDITIQHIKKGMNGKIEPDPECIALPR